MHDTSTAGLALLAEGTVVAGRYRVMRCLKVGAMGGIYRVLDMQNDRFRALKAMLPGAAADDDLTRRFEQEAVVAGRIRSDHVVSVTDSGVMRPEGTRFIIMELLEGADLGALVRDRGALDAATVVALLEQTALGLDRIHGEGIVHRDLKPENIFLCTRDDGSPHVKILDFGIAKNVASLETLKTTRALGTPLYMAPEQLTGDATIDVHADLYALGLVAYTLLAGRPYWLPEAERAPSAFAFCNLVIAGATESASTRAGDLSMVLGVAFDAWFDKAIATAPSDRFASATEQIAALATALGVEGSPAGLHALAPPPTLRRAELASLGRWRRRGTALLVAGGVAALLLVGAFRFMGDDSRADSTAEPPEGSASPSAPPPVKPQPSATDPVEPMPAATPENAPGPVKSAVPRPQKTSPSLIQPAPSASSRVRPPRDPLNDL